VPNWRLWIWWEMLNVPAVKAAKSCTCTCACWKLLPGAKWKLPDTCSPRERTNNQAPTISHACRQSTLAVAGEDRSITRGHLPSALPHSLARCSRLFDRARLETLRWSHRPANTKASTQTRTPDTLKHALTHHTSAQHIIQGSHLFDLLQVP